MVLKPDCTIKSAWELLKHSATLALQPTVSDLIGQVIDIFAKAPCSNVLSGVDNHWPRGIQK